MERRLLTLSVPKNVKKTDIRRIPDIHYFPKIFTRVTHPQTAPSTMSFDMIYEFKAISMDNWQLSTTLHHFFPSQRIRCEEFLLSHKWWVVGKISIRYVPDVDVMTTFLFFSYPNRDGNFLLFWDRKSFFNCFLTTKWSGKQKKEKKKKKSFTFSAKNLVSFIT